MTATLKPGTYVGTGSGFDYTIEVEVTLTETEIHAVRFLRTVPPEDDPPAMLELATTRIPQRIVARQTLDVDTISGATVSSKGVIEAVADAIRQAGGDPDDFRSAIGNVSIDVPAERAALGSTHVPTRWDASYDVIVVGGGFACLAAAHRAAQLGAHTLIVEKMPMVGGNSQINGGVYASYTSKLAAGLQQRFHLKPDTAEQHIQDTLVGGDFMGEPELITDFVYGSPFYLDLLLDNGLEVRDSLTRPGGHYGYRTYTLKNGVGADIVRIQKRLAAEAGAETIVDSKLVQLYRETGGDGRVVGIRVHGPDGYRDLGATRGVVLATGGFSANVRMRSQQVPFLTADFPTTNQVGATGEGITIAQEVGANTMQMSYIQLYPFANPDNGVLDAYAVIPFSGPSSGVVYVNSAGERYVNEGERRDVCAKAAQDSGGFPTFCILNQRIVDEGGFVSAEQLEGGLATGRIYQAPTLEALADVISAHTYKGRSVALPPAALAATIAKHNEFVRQGHDPDFNKVVTAGVMLTQESGPYYAIPQWPSVHHTMGGITVTRDTRVLDVWGEVIPGLFAAGEVAGGTHGTNRLGSNAMPECCVHGYMAGQNAAVGTVPDFEARAKGDPAWQHEPATAGV